MVTTSVKASAIQLFSVKASEEEYKEGPTLRATISMI